MSSYDDHDDHDDQSATDEPGYNYPVLTFDGVQVDDEMGEMERVQVSFPAAENGEQTEADESAPLGWCNSAAITLDREDDAITISISVGDPRGAFAFTVRRLKDGSLIMHTPYPGEPFEHMPLTELRPGTYRIG